MSRIDRIRQTVSARRAARAQAERTEEAFEPASANLPVPVGPVVAPRTFREERRRGDAEVSAQLMGQDGQRRGLRAGPSIFDIARAAYTRTEWSGSYDRRARKGRAARTEV
jgi:hypothetical protein